MEILINPGKKKSNSWRNRNKIGTISWETGFQIQLDKGMTGPGLPLFMKTLLKTVSVNKSWMPHLYFYQTSVKFCVMISINTIWQIQSEGLGFR